jgi:HAD superfamily hydrolase (TIGR01509 family)
MLYDGSRDENGIARFFGPLITSWESGTAKPETKIFLTAIEGMGISLSEAIHIGDSVRDDVEGAEAAGIRSVLLNRRGACQGSGTAS